MTEHIKQNIEKTIFKGGFVNVNLRNYIILLSEIRHPNSIEKEFKEAFKDIEKRKGDIHPETKKSCFDLIDSLWDEYPEGERELYKKGHIVTTENGIKVTRKIINT